MPLAEEAQDLKAALETLDETRDAAIDAARQTIKASKAAIYAAIREDEAEAQTRLEETWAKARRLKALFTPEPALWTEELFWVALGEAVEAEVVVRYVFSGTLPGRRDLPEDVPLPTFLHGLFDAAGELLRAASERMIKGDLAFAEKTKETLWRVYFLGLELDLKRFDLRRKLDYLSDVLKKLEEFLFFAHMRRV